MAYAAAGRYVVQKAEGVGGNPIPEDEPCIVIRGQDILADRVLRDYLVNYCKFDNADPSVIAELRYLRTRVKDWQRIHGYKVADR